VDGAREVQLSVGTVRAEAAEVRAACERTASPVVFCHNDLTPGNILYDRAKLVAGEGGIHLIDFEYASYSFRGFDIANHFSEYVGTECDARLYPEESAQKEFFQHYLAARDSTTGRDGFEMTRTVDEVHRPSLTVPSLVVLGAAL
jgi:ethanolamine kinase